MSSAALVSAARVKGAIDVGSNDFNVRRFSISTTGRADALPAAWAGKFIRVFFDSATATDLAFIGFSKNSAAAIDGTVAASDAGAATSVGLVLKPGDTLYLMLPTKLASESVYFVRDGVGTLTAGTTYLMVSLAS